MQLITLEEVRSTAQRETMSVQLNVDSSDNKSFELQPCVDACNGLMLRRLKRQILLFIPTAQPMSVPL